MADDLTADLTETTIETPAAAPAAAEAPAKRPAKKAAAKKSTAKKTAAKKAAAAPAEDAVASEPVEGAAEAKPAKKTAAKKAAKRPAKKAAAPAVEPTEGAASQTAEAPAAAPGVLFQAPETTAPRRRTRKATAEPVAPVIDEIAEDEDELEVAGEAVADAAVAPTDDSDDPWAAYDDSDSATGTDAGEASDEEDDAEGDEGDDGDEGGNTPARRRRRRGGRRRRKPGTGGAAGDDAEASEAEDGAEVSDEASEGADDAEGSDDDSEGGEGGTSRRRRRRRRAGESGGTGDDDPENTVVRVRESRPLDQQITSIAGSTRLEAKKQRRRDGREAGRRRAPIVSEAEFLARRESVERVMVVRQRDDLTQIGVLEDKVLVEHYVARESQTSLIGNIYLGRVQNVLPSMEAAFVDIGKGRNAVIYAGEVNWSALGHKDGQPRKIESVLSSGQTILVQVTKDPVGHKGARLTSQISLAGRFLVYVPDGTTSGISRKLPDTERNRLKHLLKEIVPDTAGVIVRTAAEGASEDELTRDVERLKARWDDIEAKSKGSAPQLLYGEPDLTLKVVRDLFTEDFAKLVIQGDEAWETVSNYVEHVAPDLAERMEKYEGGSDLFHVHRVEEQIAKGLDRKVWLPSGGSLVIDRTEAMTVVDVNTGKFTGSGGNLEETVTKNNLEAAEEIVRQLRLRDIGGIIVVDFIDMVLESNRDLVLRRLVECLGRDRTRHQVAEVTSLGLVQMTRKRIGTGLVEAFSETCTHCQGRGIVIHDHPVATSGAPSVEPDEPRTGNRRRRGGRGRSGEGEDTTQIEVKPVVPSPKVIASLPRHEPDEIIHFDELLETTADLTDEEIEVIETSEAPLEPGEETPAVVEPEVAEVAQVAEVVVLSEPEAPVEAEAPKVITRTRGRRGASTAVISTGEAAVVEISADETAAVTVAEPTPAPVVITRTRRGASRDVVHTRDDE